MKTRLIALFLLLLFNSTTWAQRPFITEWIPTQNTGTNNYEIEILTNPMYSYNYNITWENLTSPGLGNGSASNVTGNLTIIVPYNIYKISINGIFPHIRTYPGKLRSINQWGDIQWQSFLASFSNHTDLLLLATDTPDLSQVISMENMFSGCMLFTGNPSMSNWNTENIQNMSSMFFGCRSFNQPINTWNTSNVKDMSLMFYHAENFNQALDNWNTGNVTDMSYMFENCTNFNQPIGNWDVSSVTNMSHMFENCTNFNQPLGNWDVANVTDMSSMFAFTSFNQPVNNWNTSKVVKMCSLFANHYFNQPINNWDVSKVDCMSGMFGSAFNQPVGNWNTSSLKYIFQLARSPFNQNLGSWNVSNLILGVQAFDFTSMSMENYDSTLIGWSSQNLRDSVTLGALNKQYCNSVIERKSMIINHKWNFVGDIQSCLTEVEEMLESPQISLYPNPNIGSFTVQSIENDRYEIYDVHGKRVSEGKIFPGKNAIQVSLASGLYVIKLLEQDKNIKMVVE